MSALLIVLGALFGWWVRAWLPPRELAVLETVEDRGARGKESRVDVWPPQRFLGRLLRRSGLLPVLLILRVRGLVTGPVVDGQWHVAITPKGQRRRATARRVPA